MITLTSVMFPLGIIAILINSPCFPTFAGIVLKVIYGDEICFNEKKYSIFSLFTIIKITLIIFDSIIFAQAFFSASLNCFHFLTTSLLSLWEHLISLNQQKITMNINHYEIDEKIKTFKSLRVLDNLCAAAFSSRIIPSCASILCICQICSTFICLMLKNSISISIYFLYFLMCIDSTAFTIIFTTAASKIYLNSNDFLKTMQFQSGCFKSSKNKTWKLIRLQMKTCSYLKVKFGSNFFDDKTPLVFQDFCWTKIASAILLYRSKY